MNRPCENFKDCGNVATDKHHCFSQTKVNVRHYGRKLIDSEFNIRYYCNQCHGSHRNVKKEHLWNEDGFRKAARFFDFDLPEPMKSYKRGDD